MTENKTLKAQPALITEFHTNCQHCDAQLPHSQGCCPECAAPARIPCAVVSFPGPPLWRRGLAALLDRLVPLPFLAFIWPEWLIAVAAWSLLCDCSPERRSFGKRICRLRVVSAASGRPCHRWQAALRRVGIALTQIAWCLWAWLPVVLLYELAALACALLNRHGRRPEDFLAGTRVITEKAFRQLQKQR